ncbi:hypothetical protein AGMMS49928_27610 [Spirochaetia bacterium]|nr:hypothetical protein AGMMS49928_27610 [Spirochaetia bacterium]
MKVAVLPLGFEKNYGAILQTIALQNTLKHYGYDVDVIWFKSAEKNGRLRKLLAFFSLYGSLKDIKEYINDLFRQLIFHKAQPVSDEILERRLLFSQKNVNSTKKVNERTIGQIVPNYDAIVVGSDQIWTGLNKRQLPFLFDWEPEFAGLRISYAACSRFSVIPFFNRKKAKQCFLKFHAISVRDDTTYNLVYNSSGLKPQIVVDPVLLYDFDEFITSPPNNEQYIFVYIIGDKIKGKGGHNAVISRIRKKYGALKTIAAVLPENSCDAADFADKVIYDASPAEWLNLLYHAAFVYTDSFHGCVFSLKFKKEFIGYYSYSSRSTRLKSLSEQYNLDKHIVSSVRDILNKESIEDKIDYDSIHLSINKNKEESLQFLLGSLSETGIQRG